MDSHLPAIDRQEPETAGRLRPVAPGLWATPDEPLGGPANTCGFVLQRPTGNAFVYSCNTITEYYEHLDELGGISLILLTHRDEATRHVTTLADHYGAPVHTHVLEVEACKAKGVRDIDAFSADTAFGPDLQAIHAPGHTPGNAAYRWHNPHDDKRYLFTGDTFTNFTIDRFPTVLGFHRYEGNVADARRTLRRVHDIDSDVLVPGLANGTIRAYSWTAQQRHDLIDHALSQLSSV